MKQQPSRIIGAGLAGLLAAYAWPGIPILESRTTPDAAHKALLRFRSDAVSRLTGIPFRRITVRKGIWYQGTFTEPTIALANAYSRKIVGKVVGDRSIWNLEPVERWVAPADLYDLLVDHANDRIQWGKPDDFRHWREDGPIISTAPLPIAMAALDLPPLDLTRAAIEVERWTLPGADVFQTVYFPDPSYALYRASITGDMIIMEYIQDNPGDVSMAGILEQAFGLDMEGAEMLDHKVTQKYGKIIPLPDGTRKSVLFRLTHEFGIYSLGRFACWRNLLLDDVVDDIDVIRRLMRTGSYDLRRLTGETADG